MTSDRHQQPPFWGVTHHPLDWTLGGEYLLAALARLRESFAPVGIRFLATGPEVERLLFTAADLGISSCVDMAAGDLNSRQPRNPSWVFFGMRGTQTVRAHDLNQNPPVPIVAPTGFETDHRCLLYYETRSVDSLVSAIEQACRWSSSVEA